MKKILAISILAMLVLMLVCTVVKATTQSELEEYLLGSVTINGKEVSLTSAEKKQVKDYLASHKLTDAQATTIKTKVDECINVMKNAGVTQVQNLKTADKQKLLSIAQEAAAAINLKVDTSTGVVTDEAGNVVFTLPEGKLVQTGSSNIAYVVIAGLAIIAVVGTVAYKKVRA